MSNAPSLISGAGTAPAGNSCSLADTRGGAIYVTGKTEYAASMTAMGGGTSYETAFWEIACGKQDGKVDGTVPASSGAAPRANAGGNVRQQFRLTGFSHEPDYKDPIAQTVTHYAITKLASLARSI
jgi:predicted outer membrane repeat protein